MSTLPEIVILANTLEDKLYEANGQLTPELEEELAMTGMMLKDKIDTYCFVIKTMEAKAKMAIEHMQQWADIAKRCETAQANLQMRIHGAMQVLDYPEIHGMEFTVKRQLNPPAVKIIDEKLIPGEFYITKHETKLSLSLIKEAITKDGRLVPGCDLERKEKIVIKPSARRIEQ